MNSIIDAVENPDLEEAGQLALLSSEALFGHQSRLLRGANDVPGLLRIRLSFDIGETESGCQSLAILLREGLLNRLMRLDATDAFTFPREEAAELDPERLAFDLAPRRIQHAYFADVLIPWADPEAGDVVSMPWRALPEKMLGLIYGLGPDCIAAARP